MVDGEEVDLGLVGDVISVRTEAIAGLIRSGSVPVVASIAPDVERRGAQRQRRYRSGCAGRCARSRAAGRADRRGGPLPRLARQQRGDHRVVGDRAARLDAELQSGMVPKMEACLRAVEGGLTRATVTDGRVPHALLLEIFTNAGIGTMVTQDGLVRLGSRVFSRDQGIPAHEYANGDFGPAAVEPPARSPPMTADPATP